jgi:hypothetical protein
MACPSGWVTVGSCHDYACSDSSCDNPAWENDKIRYKHEYDKCSPYYGGPTYCYYKQSIFDDCQC